MRQITRISQISKILLVSSLSLYGHNVLAEMYKWIDDEGNTHYTQSPPPGDIQAKKIKPPPKIDSTQAVEQLQHRQKQLEESRIQRNKTAEQKREKQRELEKQRAECEQAKARLASYERPRVNLLDKDGNPTRATEEQRQAELARSKELVKQLCK